MWGMVNVLQIIANMPLFALSFPANVQMIFTIIINATNFSFFSTLALRDFFFKFTTTDALNYNFDAMGYSDMNLVDNMGSMFWYMPLLIIIYLLLAVFKRVTRSSER